MSDPSQVNLYLLKTTGRDKRDSYKTVTRQLQRPQVTKVPSGPTKEDNEEQRKTMKHRETQRNTEKHREILINTEKCKELQINTETCSWRNTEKCKGIQRNIVMTMMIFLYCNKRLLF